MGLTLLLAIFYYVIAELSRRVASTPESVTPVWPPDGIAVGGVLLLGNKVLPGVFLGSFLANFWAFRDPTSWITQITAALAVVGVALSTSIGTYLGTSLFRKSKTPHRSLLTVTNVYQFLLCAGLMGPLVNATGGVLCLTVTGKISGSAYASTWFTWWVSNVCGILIVTPVLLGLSRLKKQFLALFKSEGKWYAPIEEDVILPYPQSSGIGLILKPALVIGITVLICSIAFITNYHWEYLVLPSLIWSAFSLGPAWSNLLTLLIAIIAVLATVNGYGGFVENELDYALSQLQLFIAAIAITNLILNATIQERAQAQAKLYRAIVELEDSNSALETRVQERTQELHRKNAALGQTLETLQRTQAQMLQSEKMSALGQMVAGVAHEINNPVNFIHGNLPYLLEHTTSLLTALEGYKQYHPQVEPQLQATLDDLELDFIEDDLPKMLQSMRNGTSRVKEIVQSLHSFSRRSNNGLKPVDIHEGIESTIVILQHRLNATSQYPAIQLIREYGELPCIKCDVAALNQVFMNLLSNAIDAIEEARTGELVCRPDDEASFIRIQTQQTHPDRFMVAIADNGAGIPNHIRSELFNPFFTTKPVGKGTGLGLSICHQIVVEQHGGSIWCASVEGEGTTFFIELPIDPSIDFGSK